jgi:hypothetical protein
VPQSGSTASHSRLCASSDRQRCHAEAGAPGTGHTDTAISPRTCYPANKPEQSPGMQEGGDVCEALLGNPIWPLISASIRILSLLNDDSAETILNRSKVFTALQQALYTGLYSNVCHSLKRHIRQQTLENGKLIPFTLPDKTKTPARYLWEAEDYYARLSLSGESQGSRRTRSTTGTEFLPRVLWTKERGPGVAFTEALALDPDCVRTLEGYVD